MCKHGNPLYKQEIYYVSNQNCHIYIWGKLFYIWNFVFFICFFPLYFNFKRIKICHFYPFFLYFTIKILSYFFFFPYFLALKYSKFYHFLMFFFQSFPHFSIKNVPLILNLPCIISKLLNKHSRLLYKHLLNFTSWHALNIFFIKVGIPWRHRNDNAELTVRCDNDVLNDNFVLFRPNIFIKSMYFFIFRWFSRIKVTKCMHKTI